MKGCVFLLYLCMTALPVWSTKIYFTDGENALQYEVDDSKRTVQSCNTVPASDVDEEREIRDPNVVIHDLTSDHLTLIARECSRHTIDAAQEFTRVKRKESLLIYKGTKWCGISNIAAHDNDLGEKKFTDACCRTHDKCKPYLKAWACKGSFCNDWFWSRFECSCDDAFFKCLKAAAKTHENTTANDVGSLYFDIMPNKCYQNGTIKKCVKTGWLDLGCEKYKATYGLHWITRKTKFCPEKGPC
ncbi:phospholipase A2 phospholipin-like [Gigantopelta aegis]|uniref:phospholipase A2 phospholipin-like n=1 Tax=Gigantopelta aegis TaxID=1735272 RepID=UPI001B8877C8|nr:phospholipase A2 phospholipin-like [Gigantopelta aegis]